MSPPWRASEAKASRQFRRLWDVIEELREKNELTEEEAAIRFGFVRSTWFNYRARGTTPFGLLETIASGLGGELQSVVISTKDVSHGTSEDETLEEPMLEEMRGLLHELEALPDTQRIQIVGAIRGMVAMAKMNPPEPAADEGASRGRGSKK